MQQTNKKLHFYSKINTYVSKSVYLDLIKNEKNLPAVAKSRSSVKQKGKGKNARMQFASKFSWILG